MSIPLDLMGIFYYQKFCLLTYETNSFLIIIDMTIKQLKKIKKIQEP